MTAANSIWFHLAPHRARRVCLYRSPDHPSSSHLLLGTPHETETHAGPTAVFTHCKSRGEPETCPHTNTHNYYLICTICDASSYSLHQVSSEQQGLCLMDILKNPRLKFIRYALDGFFIFRFSGFHFGPWLHVLISSDPNGKGCLPDVSREKKLSSL